MAVSNRIAQFEKRRPSPGRPSPGDSINSSRGPATPSGASVASNSSMNTGIAASLVSYQSSLTPESSPSKKSPSLRNTSFEFTVSSEEESPSPIKFQQPSPSSRRALPGDLSVSSSNSNHESPRVIKTQPSPMSMSRNQRPMPGSSPSNGSLSIGNPHAKKNFKHGHQNQTNAPTPISRIRPSPGGGVSKKTAPSPGGGENKSFGFGNTAVSNVNINTNSNQKPRRRPPSPGMGLIMSANQRRPPSPGMSVGSMSVATVATGNLRPPSPNLGLGMGHVRPPSPGRLSPAPPGIHILVSNLDDNDDDDDDDDEEEIGEQQKKAFVVIKGEDAKEEPSFETPTKDASSSNLSPRQRFIFTKRETGVTPPSSINVNAADSRSGLSSPIDASELTSRPGGARIDESGEFKKSAISVGSLNKKQSYNPLRNNPLFLKKMAEAADSSDSDFSDDEELEQVHNNAKNKLQELNNVADKAGSLKNLTTEHLPDVEEDFDRPVKFIEGPAPIKYRNDLGVEDVANRNTKDASNVGSVNKNVQNSYIVPSQLVKTKILDVDTTPSIDEDKDSTSNSESDSDGDNDSEELKQPQDVTKSIIVSRVEVAEDDVSTEELKIKASPFITKRKDSTLSSQSESEELKQPQDATKPIIASRVEEAEDKVSTEESKIKASPFIRTPRRSMAEELKKKRDRLKSARKMGSGKLTTSGDQDKEESETPLSVKANNTTSDPDKDHSLDDSEEFPIIAQYGKKSDNETTSLEDRNILKDKTSPSTITISEEKIEETENSDDDISSDSGGDEDAEEENDTPESSEKLQEIGKEAVSTPIKKTLSDVLEPKKESEEKPEKRPSRISKYMRKRSIKARAPDMHMGTSTKSTISVSDASIASEGNASTASVRLASGRSRREMLTKMKGRMSSRSPSPSPLIKKHVPSPKRPRPKTAMQKMIDARILSSTRSNDASSVVSEEQEIKPLRRERKGSSENNVRSKMIASLHSAPSDEQSINAYEEGDYSIDIAKSGSSEHLTVRKGLNMLKMQNAAMNSYDKINENKDGVNGKKSSQRSLPNASENLERMQILKEQREKRLKKMEKQKMTLHLKEESIRLANYMKKKESSKNEKEEVSAYQVDNDDLISETSSKNIEDEDDDDFSIDIDEFSIPSSPERNSPGKRSIDESSIPSSPERNSPGKRSIDEFSIPSSPEGNSPGKRSIDEFSIPSSPERNSPRKGSLEAEDTSTDKGNLGPIRSNSPWANAMEERLKSSGDEQHFDDQFQTDGWDSESKSDVGNFLSSPLRQSPISNVEEMAEPSPGKSLIFYEEAVDESDVIAPREAEFVGTNAFVGPFEELLPRSTNPFFVRVCEPSFPTSLITSVQPLRLDNSFENIEENEPQSNDDVAGIATNGDVDEETSLMQPRNLQYSPNGDNRGDGNYSLSRRSPGHKMVSPNKLHKIDEGKSLKSPDWKGISPREMIKIDEVQPQKSPDKVTSPKKRYNIDEDRPITNETKIHNSRDERPDQNNGYLEFATHNNLNNSYQSLGKNAGSPQNDDESLFAESTLIGQAHVNSDDEDTLDPNKGSESLAQWWENSYAPTQDEDVNSDIKKALSQASDSFKQHDNDLDGGSNGDSDDDVFFGLDAKTPRGKERADSRSSRKGRLETIPSEDDSVFDDIMNAKPEPTMKNSRANHRTQVRDSKISNHPHGSNQMNPPPPPAHSPPKRRKAPKHRDDGTFDDIIEDERSHTSGSSGSRSAGSYTFASDTVESMALSSKERRKWNEWDKKDQDAVYTNGSATVDSYKEERKRSILHMERRARAHEQLLMHAYTALSKPPPMTLQEKGTHLENSVPMRQDTARQDTARHNMPQTVWQEQQAVENNPTRRNITSRQGTSSQQRTSSRHESISKNGTPSKNYPSAIPSRQILENFCVQIKNSPLEVLKINRDNKWQARHLTVSKEGTWLNQSSKKDACFCPLGLLWVKKFNKSNGHSITSINKQGRGGILFVHMARVQMEKHLLNQYPPSSRQIEKFQQPVVIRLYSNGRGNSSHVTLLCSRVAAETIIVGCSAITETLKRNNSEHQKNVQLKQGSERSKQSGTSSGQNYMVREQDMAQKHSSSQMYIRNQSQAAAIPQQYMPNNQQDEARHSAITASDNYIGNGQVVATNYADSGAPNLWEA
uniref:Uncharacterized protein n=1 Tax=Chaetoceros debilis TaxID=122233 RepID=A0A7S3VFR9_9STRA